MGIFGKPVGSTSDLSGLSDISLTCIFDFNSQSFQTIKMPVQRALSDLVTSRCRNLSSTKFSYQSRDKHGGKSALLAMFRFDLIRIESGRIDKDGSFTSRLDLNAKIVND